MSDPRDPRDHRKPEAEDDDEPGEHQPPPTPIWKRKGVLILTGTVIIILIFIFTRTGTVQAPTPTGKDSVIAVQKPYDDALKENAVIKAAAPATVMQPPPPPAPPPPPFNLPVLNPTGSTAKPSGSAPTRTAMVSYPVQIHPVEPPKETRPPTEPDRTKIDFKTATLPGAKASPAIDQTYLLMPGLLPIVLNSAIDSNLPGPIYAHLAGPVYSPKGVLLMEASTQVVGKYESMKQNGVNRLEAISTAAYTPNGIVVPLAGDSLGDDLGRTGLSATIDKRLIERFGGAVLLDLSQAGLSIVQANVAKGGNTYLSFNGSDRLANQILQSTINLPPIGTKNHGSTIAILITAPIDFSDSYRVVAK